MTYTLITATADGEVKASTFDNERLARQAQSIALYGMTLEEAEAAEQRLAKNLKAGLYENGQMGPTWSPAHGEWCQSLPGGQFSVRSSRNVKTAKIIGPDGPIS